MRAVAVAAPGALTGALLREEKIQAHQDRVSAKVKAIRMKNKRLKRSKNAFIDAALRGEGYRKKEDGDITDLEDFIVCKPGRDYDRVLERRQLKQMKQIQFRPRSDLFGRPAPPMPTRPRIEEEGEEVGGSPQ